MVHPILEGQGKAIWEQTGSLIKPFRVALNIAIGILLVLVGYLSSAFINRGAPPVAVPGQSKPLRVVQLDVLNGCGVKGAATMVTSALRNEGFDVVEMNNYKTFSVPQTILIDRVGDLASARRVAAALGVGEKNIIQQLSPDYFVDVSVVIGADYSTLRPAH